MGMRLSTDAASEDDELHEINVTPFIDVMLVLLIIFMVAAPMSTVDVPLRLPTSTAPASPRAEAPLIVSLRADLTLSLGDDPVARDALPARLKAAQKPDDPRLYLRADSAVPYGDLMAVMDLLRDSGFAQVALVAEERAP